MHVMILAAGRGERMRPLTDHCPKPLLEVAGKPLIVHHLEKLAAAGLCDIVINHAWLGGQIESRLGDGSAWGVRIRYSPENPALETAGGIAKALPLLGVQPFAVINGDALSDFPYARLPELAAELTTRSKPSAKLVLVPKPDYKTGADLCLPAGAAVAMHRAGAQPLTFSGIAVYQPSFFTGVAADRPSPLLPRFQQAIADDCLFGELHAGRWIDVGTVERLEAAQQMFADWA